jgi:peroxiredoxin
LARKADLDKLQALGVQVLGISTNHPFSQKAFADSLKLTYPLLSDETMAVTRAYKVVYGETPGKIDYPHNVGKIAKRYFFLIDREGIVRGKWLGEDLAVFPTDVLVTAARAMVSQR